MLRGNQRQNSHSYHLPPHQHTHILLRSYYCRTIYAICSHPTVLQWVSYICIESIFRLFLFRTVWLLTTDSAVSGCASRCWLEKGCQRGVQSGTWDALTKKKKVRFTKNIYACGYHVFICFEWSQTEQFFHLLCWMLYITSCCRAFILVVQHSNSWISAETRSMASSILKRPSLFCPTFKFESLSNGTNDMGRYKGKIQEK